MDIVCMYGWGGESRVNSFASLCEFIRVGCMLLYLFSLKF